MQSSHEVIYGHQVGTGGFSAVASSHCEAAEQERSVLSYNDFISVVATKKKIV